MSTAIVLLLISVVTGGVYSYFVEHGNREHHKVGIYNGNATTINMYPFVASVVLDPEEFLVGTAVILNENWVLTTAYTASEFGTDRMVLRVRSSRWNYGGQTVGVEWAVIHPNYTGDWDYDVAVLKTDKPLKLSRKAKAATLGTKQLAADTTGNVLGWGPPNSKEIAPTKFLKVAHNTVMDYSQCKTQLSENHGDTLFCTKVEEAGPCAGDFGSPLVWNDQVYGLYAGSDNCAEKPRLYVNIPNLANWINAAIKA